MTPEQHAVQALTELVKCKNIVDSGQLLPGGWSQWDAAWKIARATVAELEATKTQRPR